MASLSGLVSVNCDKLTLRKPSPSFEKQDVFSCFVRNPEGFSTYQGSTWNPLDNQHVPGTLDMYTHVDASVANVYMQLAELQSDLLSTRQHLVDTIYQTGIMESNLDARLSALEGKVEEQSQETGGIWAHIESILGWINFIGAILSRIEQVLVTLGLL
jgi:hypothetical protein